MKFVKADEIPATIRKQFRVISSFNPAVIRKTLHGARRPALSLLSAGLTSKTINFDGVATSMPPQERGMVFEGDTPLQPGDEEGDESSGEAMSSTGDGNDRS